ncbi:CopD family protein [Accumulibacter sp.]|uniref:CopD family protein n=1 Tax=Accumulibacter sp. TaxID=2053492 RepID=UPI0025D70811|nr:CopD family protein [Accumulibacter sp.]MCM8596312.1 CopD family protein [Accumulibacter sp.]MCM8627446.1 CopD family protein [Accumulibacter sp.]MDS4050461.1 CopD family protein [Accumulibacter sp.]
MFRQFLIYLHLLGVIVWIGGMSFAYFFLRPAAIEVLEPAQRLPLWAETFARFLRAVAVAVGVIVASGLAMLLPIGLHKAPLGWHIMLALGLVMAAIYGYVHLVLYPRLRTHCAAASWPAAGQALNGIRRLVAVNLALGLCTIAAAISAR